MLFISKYLKKSGHVLFILKFKYNKSADHYTKAQSRVAKENSIESKVDKENHKPVILTEKKIDQKREPTNSMYINTASANKLVKTGKYYV